MDVCFLPTLSEILSQSEGSGGAVSCPAQPQQRARAERQWCGAIAAVNQLLQQHLDQHLENSEFVASPGLVLSGPASVLSQPSLLDHLGTWVFTANPLRAWKTRPFQLPAALNSPTNPAPPPSEVETTTLPLLPEDPLSTEQFCLVLTPGLSLVMALGAPATHSAGFRFSFDPEVITAAWQALRPRIYATSPHALQQLDAYWDQVQVSAPDYRTVTQFSQVLLQSLPEPWEEGRSARAENYSTPHASVPLARLASLSTPNDPKASPDVELLQAIAHEVRTPLSTIRTLTRLLLKRRDLGADVIKRLEIIDRECSEQINRFGLIFRAVELETATQKSAVMPLATTSLDQVLQQSIPRWQQQAQQRGLVLDVLLPQKMPLIVSDPTMLDQALTSLIERFTRNLPGGSHIQVQVMLAGDQLKLQLRSQPQGQEATDSGETLTATVPAATPPKRSALKSIGQLLMFQPETGSLSLSLGVTKNLFQALGGKLTVRQRPQQGEILTVFLPLEVNSRDRYSL